MGRKESKQTNKWCYVFYYSVIVLVRDVSQLEAMEEHITSVLLVCIAVKSGIFGETAKFGQRLVCFTFQILESKSKLSKQTVKILMRRLIRSRLIRISSVVNVEPNISDVRRKC